MKAIATGYLAVWPTRRLVKVRVEPCRSVFPFVVVPVDPTDKLEPFPIADLSLIKLYRTEKSGEKDQLENLHKQYATERRKLRVQQHRYKWALRQVEDYKHFSALQNPIFEMK